jgi:hypothetical protein
MKKHTSKVNIGYGDWWRNTWKTTEQAMTGRPLILKKYRKSAKAIC